VTGNLVRGNKCEFHVETPAFNIEQAAPQVNLTHPSNSRRYRRLDGSRRHAVSKAKGMDAAEVLPWLSTVTMTFSIADPISLRLIAGWDIGLVGN